MVWNKPIRDTKIWNPKLLKEAGCEEGKRRKKKVKKKCVKWLDLEENQAKMARQFGTPNLGRPVLGWWQGIREKIGPSKPIS